MPSKTLFVVTCDLCKERKEFDCEGTAERTCCRIPLYDTAAYVCEACANRVIQWAASVGKLRH